MLKNNPLSYQGARTDIIWYIKEPKRVLDVGCNKGATGKLIKKVFSNNPTVLGLDYNEECIEEAKLCLDEAYVCDLDCLDSLKLIIDGFSQFDTIIMADVLEHLRYPEEVVLIFFSKLEKLGRIIISLPNTGFYTSYLHFLKQKWPRNDRGVYDKTHIKFYFKNNLEELRPPNSDFSIVSRNYRTQEKGASAFDKIIIPLVSRLPYIREFFTFQYICVIEKK